MILGGALLSPLNLALDSLADHIKARLTFGQDGINPRRCSFGKGQA